MSESTDGQFDLDALKQVKDHCRELEMSNSQRVKMQKDMEDLYFMKWPEEAAVKGQIENVKVTKTPRARNAIVGALRLMIATDPMFSVPHDVNDKKAQGVASKLERFVNAMWFASGRINGDPIHYDVVRSALLFSEIHIAITSTNDLKRYNKGSNPAMEARAEYVAEHTPYLFDVWNPQQGFPEYGPLGLQAFYRKTEIKQKDLINTFGERARQAILASRNDVSPFSDVTLKAFWDLENTNYWIDGSERPVIQERHGLSFIPIVAQRVEGSSLFSAPEEQREPFLWTLNESHIIERQNLLLTVWYTLTFGIGANPMWVNYLLDPDNPPEADFSKPGGTINMRVGERREPMAKQVIDPSIMQAWEVAQNLEVESTIYRQTLGEPLGLNAPYSMVALLSQGGRLPLTVTQRKGGWAIGEAAEIALRWIKHEKQTRTASYEDVSEELKPDEIPDKFEITAKLEITLPQDRLNAANTSAVLAQGDDPIVDKNWVRENLLNIGQPEDMQRAIWRERMSEVYFQRYYYKLLADIAQKEQMAMQPGAGAGMPGGPPPDGNLTPPGMGNQVIPTEMPPGEPQPPLPPMQPMQPEPEEIV